MFKTKPLGSLKSIFPPLHQPLPLNKRESQQLLDALTKSFRRHLDREHGWVTEDRPILLPSAPTLTYAPASPGPLKHPKLNDRRPTDRHLRAILSNPLFAYDTKSQIKKPEGRVGRDPADVFKEAAARGLMTTKRAHGYLLSVRKDVRQSASLSMTEGLRASGAGLQVVQWLKSSSKERDLSFLDNVPFTNVLLQFMVADGLGDLAWSWLDRLLIRDGAAILTRTSPSSTLLDAIVRANTEEIELNDAFEAILRGQDMFKVHEASSTNLHTAWSTLAYRSTVNSWRHSKPPADLFEKFVAIRIGQPMRLERAHLNLHHPTNPDPVQAMAFLQTPSLWSHTLTKVVDAFESKRAGDKDHRPVPNYVVKLTSLALDTVRHLTERGQAEEAQKILSFASQKLGRFFNGHSFYPEELSPG